MTGDEWPKPLWRLRAIAAVIGLAGVVGIFEVLGWELMFYLALLGLAKLLWNAKFGPPCPESESGYHDWEHGAVSATSKTCSACGKVRP